MAGTYAQTEGDILYNIARVEIEELDQTTWDVKEGGDKEVITCDSEAAVTPEMSTGQQVTLRDAKQILADAKEEDLLIAVMCTLTTCRFSPKAVAMVQGGTIRYGEGENATKIVGYDMPTQAAMANQKKYFKTTLYVKNYECSDIYNYVKITFPKCRGNGIMDLNFNKSNFFSPAFPIRATEIKSKGKSCMSFDYVDSLPSDAATTE